MRRFLFIYILLLGVGLPCLHAQIQPQRIVDGRDQYGNQVDPSSQPEQLDSANVEVQSLPPTLYMWKLEERLGTVTRMPADTIFHQFQNSNLTEGVHGHYNYLGNLGAPRLSRIYFQRPEAWPNFFMQPYSSFFVAPGDFKFTNSNVPYTNIGYYTGGGKVEGEERFKAYFSTNINKRIAFGFNVDYLYGRGMYANQSTSFWNGSLFGSYMGDHYEASVIYSVNYLKMNENGGITDDRYITDPLAMSEGKKEYEARNIPTVMSKAANHNKDFYVYVAQRYKLGFHRDLPMAEKDTVAQKEFVPVTSFIHTMKIERARHQFHSDDNLKNYYQFGPYIKPGSTSINDSTTYVGFKNTLGIALLEGFNKYAKAGLTAYASYKISKYDLMNKDSVSTDKYTENELFLGAELAKREGNTLHYHAMGEVGMAAEALGQFRVEADADLNVRLGKDTVTLIARGRVSNTLPNFYMRHYHSKYFYWDNDDMDKEFRTRLEGEINIKRWRTNLRVGIENVKNYTYFNTQALPAQFGDNIKIASAILRQDFKVGIFHLDNEVTWQKTSNIDVLPLPEFSLYHNLYIDTKLSKGVLSLQLGADVRYFTEYYAPAYMPATQQFYLQPEGDTRVKLGAYPIVNVYANLQLKRTRFFVMMYHVNQGMGNSNSFLVPHYPINPRFLKMGLSWNFYD